MVGDAHKGARPTDWSWEDVADRLRKAVEAELSRCPERERAAIADILETILLEVRNTKRIQGAFPPQPEDAGRGGEARRRETDRL
jgi:hypothetical protein